MEVTSILEDQSEGFASKVKSSAIADSGNDFHSNKERGTQLVIRKIIDTS